MKAYKQRTIASYNELSELNSLLSELNSLLSATPGRATKAHSRSNSEVTRLLSWFSQKHSVFLSHDSILGPCSNRSRGSNSGYQAWQQVLFPLSHVLGPLLSDFTVFCSRLATPERCPRVSSHCPKPTIILGTVEPHGSELYAGISHGKSSDKDGVAWFRRLPCG